MLCEAQTKQAGDLQNGLHSLSTPSPCGAKGDVRVGRERCWDHTGGFRAHPALLRPRSWPLASQGLCLIQPFGNTAQTGTIKLTFLCFSHGKVLH